MLRKRIIPCLDVRRGRLVKGVRFRDLRDCGDPVDASEAEQDRVALKLFRRSGTAPWPNCP